MTASPPPPFRIGIDVVEIPRFAAAWRRWGARWLQRLFTPAEQRLAAGRVERLAVRFAAKEAVAKALGTGIGRVAWVDIEILTTAQGEPTLHLHRAAAEQARKQSLVGWALSLSHSRHTAVAVALAWHDASPEEDAPCA